MTNLYCNFCLGNIMSSVYIHINDIVSDMIGLCFPELNIELCASGPVLCTKCMVLLVNMYVLKCRTITNEEKIQSYIKNSSLQGKLYGNVNLGLINFATNEKVFEEIPKEKIVPDNSFICRLCLLHTKKSNCLEIESEKYEVDRIGMKFLESCLPEIDMGVTSKTYICTNCLLKLYMSYRAYVKFQKTKNRLDNFLKRYRIRRKQKINYKNFSGVNDAHEDYVQYKIEASQVQMKDLISNNGLNVEDMTVESVISINDNYRFNIVLLVKSRKEPYYARIKMNVTINSRDSKVLTFLRFGIGNKCKDDKEVLSQYSEYIAKKNSQEIPENSTENDLEITSEMKKNSVKNSRAVVLLNGKYVDTDESSNTGSTNSSESSTGPTTDTPPKKVKYGCTECDYSTDVRLYMDSHYINAHIKFKECQDCDFKTKIDRDLVNHRKDVHNDDSLLSKCKECPFTTSCISELKVHVIEEHISANVDKPTSLEPNKKAKAAQKIHQCPYPVCTFSATRKELNKHMLKHVGPEDVFKFKCDVCTYRCQRSEDLRCHMEIVHSSVKYNLTNDKIIREENDVLIID